MAVFARGFPMRSAAGSIRDSIVRVYCRNVQVRFGAVVSVLQIQMQVDTRSQNDAEKVGSRHSRTDVF